MPLWSNEEWRARIGSCWCALGRLGEPATSPGNRHHEYLVLSGRTMLQAVYVLLALVLTQGVKSVNGCVTGCQRQLKNKIQPAWSSRRVLMILILLLQATSFIQSFLLLRCGDIESNPGPGLYSDLDYECIDGSTVLTEDDFREVYREVISIQSSYYQFGIELGLPLREMDVVQKAFRQDIPQAFTEVLRIFLNHRYNIDKYGPPTWRRLVEAVDNPAGGNSHALAKKIAEHHPVTQVTEKYHSASEETPVDDNIHAMPETIAQHRSKGSRELVQRCRDTMATYYLKQVDDRAWPPVKATNFINLALIKDQTSWRITVQESVDDIVGDKTKTSYQSMIDDHCFGKLTLLEGRPGSGKTVLMNKISCDWAKGEILKSKLLIFIPLRRLRAEQDRKLATLFRVACPALPQGDIKLMVSIVELTQGEGVVFAFDGFDEYVPHHNTNSHLSMTCIEDSLASDSDSKLKEKPILMEDMFKILKQEYLINSTVFLSSRPAAVTEFREHAKTRIEVLGFLKPQINEYIHCYFSTDRNKAQQLIYHLEHHPNLMNMAYLPLHCAMLAFLYEDDVFLPETETEFYRHFTLSTLLRFMRKRQHVIATTICSFDQFPHDDRVIFDQVCKLAFNATKDSKQVFTSDDIKSIVPETWREKNDVSNLGLVVTDRYFMRYGLDETYTFLHLTFQEYLAAIHINQLSELKQINIIADYFERSRFAMVRRFLCGTMDFALSTSAVRIFKKLMETAHDKLSKIQCGFETQNAMMCTRVVNSWGGHIDISNRNLSPLDCVAIGSVISLSDYPSICLDLSSCNLTDTKVVTLLQPITSRSHYHELTVLNLNDNSIGDVGAQALGEGLKLCTKLKQLCLWHNNMTIAGIRALESNINYWIQGFTKQDPHTGYYEYVKDTKLNLSDCAAIGFAVNKSCYKRVHLKLDDCKICSEGVTALLQGIGDCNCIETLNLTGNILYHDGVRAFGEWLKYCTHLKKLILDRNGIGDIGIQLLANYLKNYIPLEELSIELNYCTDAAVPHVIKIIDTMKSLKSFRLCLCWHGFSVAGIERIKEFERMKKSSIVEFVL